MFSVLTDSILSEFISFAMQIFNIQEIIFDNDQLLPKLTLDFRWLELMHIFCSKVRLFL
jgi:hypothetical protein